MLKSHYDFVYLTNTPSFYKLNLCNEICRKGHSVLIVLYGYGSEAVNTSLNKDNSEYLFDFYFLHDGDANKRSKWQTFIRLVKLMGRVSASRVLYSGWLAPEYNMYSFISPKRKNAVISESTVYDISMTGLKGLIKRAIIGRMSAALPSGKPHIEFFRSVGFKGQIEATGSVGIFHKAARQPKAQHYPLRYIYVGRLIDVKNVGMLIDEFNATGRPLTIVGKGELESELKAKARPNISFTGFIDNDILGEVYQAHDVFILPSYYEAWGLVVEEALYWGLPVIVSDRVGSAKDMVEELGTGLTFKSKDAESLHSAILKMEENYNTYQNAAASIDWQQRERRQVDAYLKLLK